MSLSSSLSIALSGLQASTLQLQMTANNIANASTPGYTAKTANLTSSAFGGAAAGVTVNGFTRTTNDVLFKSYNAATADAGLYGSQYGYLKQVQSILGSSTANPPLSTAFAKFSAAWAELQAEPESAIKQTAVIQAGVKLASTVSSAATQLNALDRQVRTDTTSSVARLNDDLSKIAALNRQIADSLGNHQPIVDLEDARDALITDISSLVSVNVLPRAQGGVAIYTADGVPLLDINAQTFTYDGATNTITNGNGQTVTSNLAGGSIQGAIQFRATSTPVSTSPGVNVIQKLSAQLSEIVNAFTQTTNASGDTTFAEAFNPGGAGDAFFTATGTDPLTFAVNSNFLDGTSTITQANVANTAATFGASFNFSASGLSLTATTYADLTTTILSNFQSAANSVSASNDSATQQRDFYKASLSNATGVNVDNELVNLTTLQNSYAAAAHVISTISEMFKTLTSII